MVVGKKMFQKIFLPKGGEFDGDESHGIESLKSHLTNKPIQVPVHPWKYMDVSKNRGTPKSSILIGFSRINHPF